MAETAPEDSVPEDPVAVWRELISPEARPLREAAVDADPTKPADVARLRKLGSAALVHAAFELVGARRRGGSKFPDTIAELVADREGMEQASSIRVAEYKAQRFRGRRVADLCSGIGGDTMALAAVAESCVAWDLDPVRAWMTATNAGCSTEVRDVAEFHDPECAIHIDPARRGEGRRRRWRLADAIPGPDVLERLLRDHPDAAVKLGPGVDREEIPATSPGELEWISDRGELRQAMWWQGALATGVGTRATTLPSGATLFAEDAAATTFPTYRADAEGKPRAFLYVPDPALERSGLVSQHPAFDELIELGSGLGVWTGDVDLSNDPWWRSYAVVGSLPWRMEKVRAWLKAHDGGGVAVKTRGGAVDPEKARRALRGEGATRYTVFVLRCGRPIVAVVTQPVGERA